MTLICGLDFETTGLDPQKDRVIEVGAVLWEWETKKPVRILNDLLQCPVRIPLETKKIHGISNEDLQNFGSNPQTVFTDLIFMIDSCQYLMGHNINDFDMPFLQAELKRNGLRVDKWPPILDIRTDIKYNTLDASRKLAHLATAHGILNPFAHRAVFDVMTMLQIASKYDLNAIVDRAKSPNITYKAMIEYADKDKAKECGFQWKHSRWVKRVKACDNETYPFPVMKINDFYF